MLKSISRKKRIKSKINFMHDDELMDDETELDPKKMPLDEEEETIDGADGAEMNDGEEDEEDDY